ncbi:MAG TPA: ATP-binding protein, partial [Candidatus Methylacidiphilales bacterium]
TWGAGPSAELEAVRLGKTGFVCVLTPDGHVVAGPPGVEDSESWLARAKPEGRSHVFDDQGQEWLAYGTTLKSGLRIVALLSEIEEDAIVDSFRSVTALILLLAAAITLPVAAFLLAPVLRPIRNLTAAAEALGRGDWSVRVKDVHGTELAALARSFNQMAGQLGDQYGKIEEKVAARTEELRRENTERRSAEASLRAKQAELQAMSDASPLGIFVTDRSGLCLYTNQVLQDIYGTPQLFGSGLFEPIEAEDRPRVEALFDGKADGGKALVSVHRIHRRKRLLWLRMRLAPLGEGDQFTGYVGTVEDITEQKLLEHRLVARTRMMETLAHAKRPEEAAPGVARALGEATEWDFAACWRIDPRLNRLVQIASWHRPSIDLSGLVRNGAEKGLAKGEGLPGRVWAEARPIWIGDADRDATDPRLPGTPPLRTALALPVFGGEGEVDGVLEVRFHDPILSDGAMIEDLGVWTATISQYLARTEAEREKEDMEIQLRHAQKMESIGQLAAGIAHEINTPTQFVGDNNRFLQGAFADLSGLLSRYEGLLQEVKAGRTAADLAPLIGEAEKAARDADVGYLAEEIPRAIRQSLDGLDRVTKIVRAMKDFSHPGSEERVPVDLNRAIESTVTVARNEWKYVADLETRFDPALPLVPCRIGEINQVVLNLVVNAAHAIGDLAQIPGRLPNGKGTITISTRPSDDGDWAEVRIADTGGGIPEAIRGKIFDPFFTTKEVGKGTGQGLAIAHSVVVDKHGGAISFETELGQGTTFLIRLPLRWEPPKK